ncbi:MAG TPA: hypothetical protein VKP30_23540 [Polyangiaceae bacterium]|nr:hypothetical protein [Polyangiaceae bacterium]
MTSADDSGARVSQLTGWAEVIKSIPASARLFALVVLVINVLMGALVWKLPSSNLLFVALAVLAAVLVTTVLVSARSTGRVATAEPKSTRFVRDDFDTASARFEAVLNQFTGSDSSLKTLALEEGDGERLLDGLFAGLLEVARLALGQDIRTSANLTELAADFRSIRVRAFSGLYSAAVILRAFDVDGLKQGVCSEAYRTGQHQIRPDMTGEMLERGERIRSMVSIPISLAKGAVAAPGDLATLNIETTEKGMVPPSVDDCLRAKLDRLGAMAAKVNDIRRQIVGMTVRTRRSFSSVPPEVKESFPPEPPTALTASQKRLYGSVLAAPDGIQLAQIEQQLPDLRRSELYYRLECLVLMGFIEKKQSIEHTIGIPCITYKSTAKRL